MYTEADYVVLFKALADETRLKMVKMLAEGDKCPCHLLKEFNITQPTLSYHTKILCDAGIITGKRTGALMECSVNFEKIQELQSLFSGLSQTLAEYTNKMENSK